MKGETGDSLEDLNFMKHFKNTVIGFLKKEIDIFEKKLRVIFTRALFHWRRERERE